MVHKTCARCGRDIPSIRLEALPDTLTCIGCSTESAKTVFDIEVDGPDQDDLARTAANAENY